MDRAAGNRAAGSRVPQPPTQRVACHAERPGGTREVAVTILQCSRDALTFLGTRAEEGVAARRRLRRGAGSDDPLWQVVRQDERTARDEDGGFHRVGELPDVARPRVPLDQPDGGGVQVTDPALVPRREGAHEMARQQQHVRAAFTQRRQVVRKDEQSVIEVEAETAGGNGTLDSDARGGDNPRVHPLHALTAEPPHLALLDGREQLRL
jgi:hypothetical protein